MICGNKECAKDFTPKTHNQKYCGDECCRIATNRRIMEKYYEKKAIRNGSVVRSCKKCNARLSVYHTEDVCSSCQNRVNQKNKNKLLRMIDEVS